MSGNTIQSVFIQFPVMSCVWVEVWMNSHALGGSSTDEEMQWPLLRSAQPHALQYDTQLSPSQVLTWVSQRPFGCYASLHHSDYIYLYIYIIYIYIYILLSSTRQNVLSAFPSAFVQAFLLDTASNIISTKKDVENWRKRKMSREKTNSNSLDSAQKRIDFNMFQLVVKLRLGDRA